MKKNLLTILFLIAFLCLQSVIYSHPIENFNMQAFSGKDTVSITVMHNIAATKVKDVSKHFVKEIKVVLNNNEFSKSQNFTKQQTPVFERTTFKFPRALKKGDKITIYAMCNLKNQTKMISFTIR